MKWFVYIIFAIIYLLITFFGIGPVLLADSIDYKKNEGMMDSRYIIHNRFPDNETRETSSAGSLAYCDRRIYWVCS